jgi:hypothetical protein
VEQELLTLPEQLDSLLVFSGVRVSRSLVFCVVLCRLLFILFPLSFGHCIACPPSILMTTLVSSNSSLKMFARYIYTIWGPGWLNELGRCRGPGWLNELGRCRARVAQWVRSLDLTTHTRLSLIRRGFAPSFVNYEKGALDSQSQVIKFTSCLPRDGGSLQVLRLPPPLKLVAMI